MTKNIKFVITRFDFSSSKCTKIRFFRRSPGPRWGSLRRSPRPPSRLGSHNLAPPLDVKIILHAAPKQDVRRGRQFIIPLTEIRVCACVR